MNMIGLYLMAFLYVVAGANHFRKPDFYLPMMPLWIPWHKLMVLLSGMAEILLGALLLWPYFQSLAAWGIIAMLVVFFSVHVYMYQARDTVFRKVPKAVLVARFPLQFVLIFWAYLYTSGVTYD